LPYVRLRMQAPVDEFYKLAFPLSFAHSLLQQLQNVRMPNGRNSNFRVSEWLVVVWWSERDGMRFYPVAGLLHNY